MNSGGEFILGLVLGIGLWATEHWEHATTTRSTLTRQSSIIIIAASSDDNDHQNRQKNTADGNRISQIIRHIITFISLHTSITDS